LSADCVVTNNANNDFAGMESWHFGVCRRCSGIASRHWKAAGRLWLAQKPVMRRLWTSTATSTLASLPRTVHSSATTAQTRGRVELVPVNTWRRCRLMARNVLVSNCCTLMPLNRRMIMVASTCDEIIPLRYLFVWFLLNETFISVDVAWNHSFSWRQSRS